MSEPDEVERALRIAQRLGFPLEAASPPPGTDTDVSPLKQNSFRRDLFRGISFNLVGGLLPQRSWFTAPHSARVLSFGACDPIGFGDYVAATILLPLGRLHGPRDRASQVDLERLFQQYAIPVEMTMLTAASTTCHLDRSEAEWRDLKPCLEMLLKNLAIQRLRFLYSDKLLFKQHVSNRNDKVGQSHAESCYLRIEISPLRPSGSRLAVRVEMTSDT